MLYLRFCIFSLCSICLFLNGISLGNAADGAGNWSIPVAGRATENGRLLLTKREEPSHYRICNDGPKAIGIHVDTGPQGIHDLSPDYCFDFTTTAKGGHKVWISHGPAHGRYMFLSVDQEPLGNSIKAVGDDIKKIGVLISTKIDKLRKSIKGGFQEFSFSKLK